MKRLGNVYQKITDFDNLYRAAWAAAKGKRKRSAIKNFLFHLENELIELQERLVQQTYTPGTYIQFVIHDPKERTISVAPFVDRVVHHAICRVIEPWLEKKFIDDSYGCRKGKGQHRALQRAVQFSRSFRYYLKCDVQKFFESIDRSILKTILSRHFKDQKLLELLAKIIDHSPQNNIGLPIENLTSQHFANTYLNELDQYIKNELRFRGFLRYMDDFIVYHNDKRALREAQVKITKFLQDNLKLQLKTKATYLNPTWQGVGFLGFRVFPGGLKIKRDSWKRFCKKFRKKQQLHHQGSIPFSEMVNSISSLLGHVSQGTTWNLRRQFLEKYTMDF